MGIYLYSHILLQINEGYHECALMSDCNQPIKLSIFKHTLKFSYRIVINHKYLHNILHRCILNLEDIILKKCCAGTSGTMNHGRSNSGRRRYSQADHARTDEVL